MGALKQLVIRIEEEARDTLHVMGIAPRSWLYEELYTLLADRLQRFVEREFIQQDHLLKVIKVADDLSPSSLVWWEVETTTGERKKVVAFELLCLIASRDFRAEEEES